MQRCITAYVGLGANLDARQETLVRAVEALCKEEEIRVTGRSAIYETAPVGGPPQPDYLNAAVSMETTLAPQVLLERCRAIEFALGRRRTEGEPPNLPRRIDLDLLLYGEEIIAEPDLVVPHPRLHERAFALLPLCDLAPSRVHPVLGRTMAELLARLHPGQAARKIEGTL